MFNIQERVPMILGGVLIAIHLLTSLAPNTIGVFARTWALLVPMDYQGLTMSRQLFSLLGAGFLHGSWTHVLVNTGMIVAFAVITLRGVRALAQAKRFQGKTVRLSPSLVFLIIFILGVIGGNLFQWGWWAVTDAAREAALGASGGGSALFATAAWAMGGREKLIKFAGGWVLINVIFVLGASILGPIAWPAHIGGFVMGALLAPYLVRPFSTGFSITR